MTEIDRDSVVGMGLCWSRRLSKYLAYRLMLYVLLALSLPLIAIVTFLCVLTLRLAQTVGECAESIVDEALTIAHVLRAEWRNWRDS